MFQGLLSNSIFKKKFLHYFLVIFSLVFLFTLGPRILVDQLSSKSPNTAIAQECGQNPCPTVPPTAPPQECTEQPRDYPQCGGDCNGTNFPSNHTVMVHKRVDNSCNVSFQCEDQGVKPGECGNPSPTQPPQPTTPPATPPPATSPPHVCSGTPCSVPVGQSTCIDHHQIFCKMDAPECGGVGCNCMVDTGSTCGGGGGGGTNPTTPPATTPPATSPPATTPPATAAPVSNSTSSSSSNSSANAAANATAQQQQQQSQSVSINNSNTNNNTNNNSQNMNLSGTVLAAATAVPTMTATPMGIAAFCPAGTTFIRMEGNNVVCQQNVTTFVAGQGGGGRTPIITGKTQVQGQVQELPNTGLPLASAALLGLAPLGWKLRKYTLKHLHPSLIWQDRELKR